MNFVAYLACVLLAAYCTDFSSESAWENFIAPLAVACGVAAIAWDCFADSAADDSDASGGSDGGGGD